MVLLPIFQIILLSELYLPLYYIQPSCLYNSSTKTTINIQGVSVIKDVVCVQGLPLWRNPSSMINNELFKGYRQNNTEKKSNDFLSDYDFLDTSEKGFNIDIWYNSTYSTNNGYSYISYPEGPVLFECEYEDDYYLERIEGVSPSSEFSVMNQVDGRGLINNGIHANENAEVNGIVNIEEKPIFPLVGDCLPDEFIYLQERSVLSVVNEPGNYATINSLKALLDQKDMELSKLVTSVMTL